MRSSSPRFKIAATVEVVSLAVLLINRATVHIDALTSSLGPIHGMAYLATIALAALSPIPRRAKTVAWIPVIGGIVALRLSHPSRQRGKAEALQSHIEPPATRVAGRPVHDPMIRLKEVTKAYRSGTQIGPLSFSVPRGRITGLVGPNGAGKTTAMRMLVGLITPTSGTIHINGEDVQLAGSLTQVGAPIESPALVPGLSGRRNIEAVAALASWPSNATDAALARVELADVAEQKVSQYSLGMKQRLALAIALLHDPTTVILDEPANGLDPQGIADLRLFLRRLADEGVTVLVSSHLLGELEQICDHLVVIADGAIRYEGPPRELNSQRTTIHVEPLHPQDLETLRAIGASHTDSQVDVAEFVIMLEGDRTTAAAIARTAIMAGIDVSRVTVTTPTLEEAFLAMTSAAPHRNVLPAEVVA